MPFLIIVLIVIVGITIYGFYKNDKQRKVNIERRKNFVTSFFPNARIILNNGNYLFFVDDARQLFGIDDSGNTYSYLGLRSLSVYDDAICFIHDSAPIGGITIGKHPLPNNPSIPLDRSSVLAIKNALFPILRYNLHKELTARGITPTHEYVNGGIIWGCDINSKVYYNTFAYFQIHDFSQLHNVTMQDVSGNPNMKCNYIITVVTKGDEILGDGNVDIYVDDKTTLNNLLAMFKGIKDRQNRFDIRTDLRDFDLMEGHEFEYFCAELLKKNGYQNVSVTQGSGDQGIDIIAYKDGIKYGVQCKCYSSDIGNKAVQEAFAGKAYYECHVGVVLTNQYFTRAAIDLAQKNGIVLWDRNKLLELISNA